MSERRFHQDRIEQFQTTDGVERSIHVWEAEETTGVFLALHGGMTHGGDFCTPAVFFKAHGWTTVAPDLQSKPGQVRVDIDHFDVFIDDVKLLLEWIRKRYPEKQVFIMGHSIGGLIATRYGLTYATDDDGVQGYIMSAPFWASTMAIPRIIVALSGILARLVPRMKAPIETFTHVLTHDEEISDRQRRDAEDGICAQEVTMRFGNEQRLMHNFVRDSIHEWKHPLFIVISGQDHLTDSKVAQEYISRIKPNLVESHFYPDNYHENLNETNREEIFELILKWTKSLVPARPV